MVDDAECYKEEKLSIVNRYAIRFAVESIHGMGFTGCSNKWLTVMIFDFPKKYGLGNTPILVQSSDRASVISVKHKSLPAITSIKEKYLHYTSVHCLAST